MSTPREEQEGRPNPFAPQPQDERPYDSSPPPAPPMMHSPYRPDEELPGQEPHKRQPPRFPALHHGSGHGTGTEQPPPPPPPFAQQPPQQAPPPFEQRSAQGSASGWGTGAAGSQPYVAPPQFSYRPETQPVPPPPAPPASDNRRKVLIGATAAVVLVAAAVTGGVLLMGGGSSKQSTTTGGVTVNSLGQDSRSSTSATTAPAKSVPAAWSAKAGNDAATVVGSWLVDSKTIVRGDTGALKAYDAQSGTASWTFQVPGQGSAICAMSQLAIAKIGLVQYGPNGNCSTVAALSTDTGKQVWSTQLSAAPGSPAGTVPQMSFGGNVVAGQVGTSVTVWSAADGKQLWTVNLATAKPACQLYQLGVKGAYVTLVENCGAGTVVAMKDSHTGRDLWQTPLPKEGLDGSQITLVQAAFPTIVHVSSQAVDNYYSFDAKGKAQTPIKGEGDYGKLDLNVGPQGQQHPLAHILDNTFVAPTADKDAKASLVAFDLVSGNKLWQSPAAAAGPVTVAAVDPTKVTVFDGGSAGSPARLLEYATNGGAPISLGTIGTLGTDWSGPAAAAYVAGDRLIVLPAAPEKGADVLAFPLR